MSVTLTANYKEIFSEKIVDQIEELLENDFDLQAMIEFIDEYNEDDFYHFYEDYVTAGEALGYECVDAYVTEYGFSDCDTMEDRYMGHFQNVADFAEEYYTNILCESIPSMIVVDWEATWDSALYYDFTAVNDGDAYCPVHIFRDN